MGGKRKELTKRQRAFAMAMAKGEDGPSACYRQAYSADKMKPSSIAVEAQKLICNPNISRTIQSEKARIEAKELYSRDSLEATEISRTRRDAAAVLLKLREWLEGGGDPTPAMLKSAEMLAKASNLFKQESSLEVINRDSASIELALIDKLRSLGIDDPIDTSETQQTLDKSVH